MEDLMKKGILCFGLGFYSGILMADIWWVGLLGILVSAILMYYLLRDLGRDDFAKDK
jgi:uncharacterized membrane protein YdjX (TVP38/TMEM64 family)